MDYTKRLEAELLHEKAKLSKMTSTVKQLGTKLKDANEMCNNLYCEKEYYKDSYFNLNDTLSKLTLSVDESHERANKFNNRGF